MKQMDDPVEEIF